MNMRGYIVVCTHCYVQDFIPTFSTISDLLQWILASIYLTTSCASWNHLPCERFHSGTLVYTVTTNFSLFSCSCVELQSTRIHSCPYLGIRVIVVCATLHMQSLQVAHDSLNIYKVSSSFAHRINIQHLDSNVHIYHSQVISGQYPCAVCTSHTTIHVDDLSDL